MTGRRGALARRDAPGGADRAHAPERPPVPAAQRRGRRAAGDQPLQERPRKSRPDVRRAVPRHRPGDPPAHRQARHRPVCPLYDQHERTWCEPLPLPVPADPERDAAGPVDQRCPPGRRPGRQEAGPDAPDSGPGPRAGDSIGRPARVDGRHPRAAATAVPGAAAGNGSVRRCWGSPVSAAHPAISLCCVMRGRRRVPGFAGFLVWRRVRRGCWRRAARWLRLPRGRGR